jgi:hypothetical protein
MTAFRDAMHADQVAWKARLLPQVREAGWWMGRVYDHTLPRRASADDQWQGMRAGEERPPAPRLGETSALALAERGPRRARARQRPRFFAVLARQGTRRELRKPPSSKDAPDNKENNVPATLQATSCYRSHGPGTFAWVHHRRAAYRQMLRSMAQRQEFASGLGGTE